MPSTTATTLTIDQIELSRLNVRIHRDDANAVASLEASILAEGLRHALSLHPLKGSKKWGAFAGGRRWRAIRNLVGRGDLPPDWPVEVKCYQGYTDAQIVEMSWGENFHRRDLHRYEDCAAAARLVKLGETTRQIAHAMGQDERLIRGWAAIGELAPEIFAAFEAGKAAGGIGYEEAQAFAATADQALQRAAWEQYRALPDYQRSPARVRQLLKIGDHQLQRRLRLVGADAYRAAGGRFELDLFAGEAEERGRIVDEGLLSDLAEARLEQVRAATRAATRPDLRFIAQPPRGQYSGPDETLRASVKARDGGGLNVPDGVVAAIEISDAGEPQVTYWWESRAAKHGSASGKAQKLEQARAASPLRAGGSAVADPYGVAPAAKAQAREEHGTSADALYAVRCVRREILRAMLVEDADAGGTVGRSYAIWAQLRYILSDRHIGAGLRSPNTSDHEVGVATSALQPARDRVEEQSAHTTWTAAVKAILAERWMTEPDQADAFRLFLYAPERDRARAGAVLSGILLERSAATPGYDFAAHRTIAECVRGTGYNSVRDAWTPTAEFLELFGKAQLLAIARPFLDDGTYARWEKMKAAELPARLSQALQGGGQDVPGRFREQARAWVHPLLAFDPPEDDGDSDPGPANDAAALEIAEAAE